MIKRVIETICILCALFFIQCKTKEEKLIAKGGKNYGGKLVIALDGLPSTLYPPKAVDIYSVNVIAQIHEPLMRMDGKTNIIKYALAKKIDIKDNIEYIIHLRTDAYFHDDKCFPGGKGRKVNAYDVEFTLKNLYKHPVNSYIYRMFLADLIEGGDEYYLQTIQGQNPEKISGINVINDSTISIKLKKPLSDFVYYLSHPVFSIIPKEAISLYGENATIGAGPFIFLKFDTANNKIILIKNKKYFLQDTLGNQLPFLDTVEFAGYLSKKEALDNFLGGKVDIIRGIPEEAIKSMLQEKGKALLGETPKYKIIMVNELGVNFYLFNMQNPALAKRETRLALNFAVDKNALVEKITKISNYPGIHGIVPPFMSTEKLKYPIELLPTFNYDIQKAKDYLSKAGYKDGKNFPQLKLVVNKETGLHEEIAKFIAEDWKKNLNIDVSITIKSLPEKIAMEEKGEADIFRSGIVADYPSPSAFLNIFYSKLIDTVSKNFFPNSGRYINPLFDSKYEEALSEQDKTNQYEKFALAEKVLMEDPPFIILWYDIGYWLVSASVHDFYPPKIRIFSLESTYKEPQIEKETNKPLSQTTEQNL